MGIEELAEAWVTKPSLSPNKNIERLKDIIFTHYDAARQV